MADHDPYLMLYCDTVGSCRVNTFEDGDGSGNTRGEAGLCPGCGQLGHRLDTHEPFEQG